MPVTDDKNAADIRERLEHFFHSYINRDIDAVMSFFSAGAGIIFAGSNSDEKFFGKEQIKKHLEAELNGKNEISRIEIEALHITARENTAWLLCDYTCKTRVGNKYLIYFLRLCAVMEKWNGAWYFSFYSNNLANK